MTMTAGFPKVRVVQIDDDKVLRLLICLWAAFFFY